MKIIHFADLHLGVETYGRIDSATGLSSRLLDFLAALDQLVDYALGNSVDLVLFCGDAYKSREPGQTQQREFARRISRLASAGIPVFLLVGNHDLPNALGKATTTEIFDTLAVKNVYVSSRPEVQAVPTPGGTVQVATLPWLRRTALLSREESQDLDFNQINQRLQEILTGVVASHAARLDPGLPAVLAAHVWVSGARVGSEKQTTIGQEPALLLSTVAHPAFDYVALGHIHRHQVLAEKPPVVYAGSLERLDFSEEADEKGFCLVDITTDPATGRRQTAFSFQPVTGRRFVTIAVNVEPDDADPTLAVLSAINGQAGRIEGAIVRLQIALPAEIEAPLRDAEIREALKGAYYFTVAKDIRRQARLRLGVGTAEEITALDALRLYLEATRVPEERARRLLEHGERLVQEQGQP